MAAQEIFRFIGARLPELWQKTAEHLVLTGMSTFLAILAGIPLGMLVVRRQGLRRSDRLRSAHDRCPDRYRQPPGGLRRRDAQALLSAEPVSSGNCWAHHVFTASPEGKLPSAKVTHIFWLYSLGLAP